MRKSDRQLQYLINWRRPLDAEDCISSVSAVCTIGCTDWLGFARVIPERLIFWTPKSEYSID